MIRVIGAFQSLDEIALGDSWLHRADPRIKLIFVLGFMITVMSAGPDSLAPVIAMLSIPVFLLVSAGIPAGPVLIRLTASLPFVLAVSIWTPFIVRNSPSAALSIYGWIALLVVILKTIQCVLMMVILAASTPVPEMAVAARNIGFPAVLVDLVQFVYRFLVLTVREALRMLRAREIRAAGGRRQGVAAAIAMLTTLLIRASERSVRVAQSMYSRGYAGRIRMSRRLRLRTVDVLLFLAGAAILLLCRFGFGPDLTFWEKVL